MYGLVYVSNIWSVPYLHDNVVLMLVSFLTFCRLVRIVNCLSSPSASMSHEKRCWGGDATAWCVCVCVCMLGGHWEESNGRLVWLSSAVAVETKQMNCEMYSKRLETSACQHPLRLYPPLLLSPGALPLSISPLFCLTHGRKKTGMTAVLCLSKTLEKEKKCHFLPLLLCRLVIPADTGLIFGSLHPF